MTKSKARQKFLPLAEPASTQTHSSKERLLWIDKLCNEFVQPSKANKEYYRVVVTTLWPDGAGIPGPYVTENDIRAAIDQYRREKLGDKYQKPYVDVFRRVRELQGEEGLTGVAREGKKFQLVSLKLSEKRIPRTSLSNDQWEAVKDSYDHSCAACKRKEPEVRFQQDHKIPRTRGGGDALTNWQPLCDECNNFKSVSCRACELDCEKCCWAYPEKYAPVKLSVQLLNSIHEYCKLHSLNPNDLVKEAIVEKISKG